MDNSYAQDNKPPTFDLLQNQASPFEVVAKYILHVFRRFFLYFICLFYKQVVFGNFVA